MFLFATLAACLSLLPCATFAQPTDILNTPEAQVLIDWIQESGGFFDPRLSIRHEVPTDKTTLRGVFAGAPIADGDLLLRVPWELCIAPTTTESGSNCTTTSQCLCYAEQNLREAIKRGNSSIHGPYVDLLLAKKIELPNVWSAEERALLLRLLGGELPPKQQRLTTHSNWWLSACHGDTSDQLALASLLLLVTRGVEVKEGPVWTIMTPVFDFLNHRNGAWSNTYLGSRAMEDFELYASRDIERGEQLYFSYKHGSDELFVHYGFVEQYPQQWTFEVEDLSEKYSSFREVQFMLDEYDTAEGLKNLVHWDGEIAQSGPSLEVVVALEGLRDRLKSRRATEGIDNTGGRSDSPHFSLIRAYVSAVETALESAVKVGRAAHVELGEESIDGVASWERERPSEAELRGIRTEN